jgi:hypothetical protein
MRPDLQNSPERFLICLSPLMFEDNIFHYVKRWIYQNLNKVSDEPPQKNTIFSDSVFSGTITRIISTQI